MRPWQILLKDKDDQTNNCDSYLPSGSTSPEFMNEEEKIQDESISWGWHIAKEKCPCVSRITQGIALKPITLSLVGNLQFICMLPLKAQCLLISKCPSPFSRLSLIAPVHE